MIDIITRSRYPELYKRMCKSAIENSYCPEDLNFLCEHDTLGVPSCASTYNRLARESKSPILGFVQDDVEFISEDWDRIIHELFDEFKPDILSVIGSDRYEGGAWCRAGSPHIFGLIGGNHDGKTQIRVFSMKFRYKPVKVVDGFFMFMPREFILKNPFDESFDELFYWDLDICLRAKNVAVTCDILIKHSKPPELFGVYPSTMKPMDHYTETFNSKHGLKGCEAGDQRCAAMDMDYLKRIGQTRSYLQFQEKYRCVSA